MAAKHKAKGGKGRSGGKGRRGGKRNMHKGK